MKTEVVEYKIPVWCLCAMVNADMSGLEDAEIDSITAFEHDLAELVKREGAKHYSINYPNDIDAEKYFSQFNDVHNLGDDVVDCEIVLFFEAVCNKCGNCEYSESRDFNAGHGVMLSAENIGMFCKKAKMRVNSNTKNLDCHSNNTKTRDCIRS